MGPSAWGLLALMDQARRKEAGRRTLVVGPVSSDGTSDRVAQARVCGLPVFRHRTGPRPRSEGVPAGSQGCRLGGWLVDRLTAQDLMLLWPEELGWSQDIGALAILDGSRLLDGDGRFRIERAREEIGRALQERAWELGAKLVAGAPT